MNYKYLSFKQKIPALILTCFIMLQFTSAEGSFDTLLIKKIEMYKERYPMEVVYLHTDRDIYAPGENLYFKAYIKDYYSTSPGIISQNLQLLLIDPQGKETLNETFQIENSQSAGKLILNKTLTEGKYTLIGHTDLMQNESQKNVFSKKLFIKKINIPYVFVKLSVPDTVFSPLEEAEIIVHLLKPNGKPYGKKSFSYMVKINGTPLVLGNGKSDKDGKSVIKINLPDYRKGSLVSVEVAVELSGIAERNSILIPTQGLPINLEFFPESGALVNGLKTKVGFRALDYLDNPLEIEGQILDTDNKVVGNFKSLSKGLGYFTIIPETKNPLKVKISKPSGFDQPFYLPEVLPMGTNLVLENKTKDFLSFIINSNLKYTSNIIHAVAEMDGLIAWYERFNISDPITFKVPIKDLPGGIIRITLFDKNGQALAQRAVFLDKISTNISFKTERNDYEPRKEINLNIQVQNYDGQPAIADLSVAIIDANLNPDWNNDPDIFTHFILGPSVNKSHLPPGYFINPSEEAYKIIDCLMLILHENKFNWEKVQKIEKNQLKERGNGDFIYKVVESHRFENLDKILAEIESDQFFYQHILKNDQVLSEYLSVNKRLMKKTSIKRKIPDQSELIQRKLASGTSILNVIKSIKPFQLMSNKIVFQGPNSFLFQSGALFVMDGIRLGTDIGVLDNINPYDIENIKIFTNPADMLIYSGLNSTGIIEITTKRGHFKTEDSNIQQLDPYNSTLYWNPYVNTLQTGEMSISFESTYMKTKYSVIIQGIDSTGRPIFNISHFSVY